jgi:hypothetical protein
VQEDAHVNEVRHRKAAVHGAEHGNPQEPRSDFEHPARSPGRGRPKRDRRDDGEDAEERQR